MNQSSKRGQIVKMEVELAIRSRRLVSNAVCRWLAMVVLVIVVASLSAIAQLAGTGGITGRVQDPGGALVAGATVTAVNVDTNVKSVRTTTSDGDYNITPLTPGTYMLVVSASGFEGYTQESITVNALSTVSVNVKLTLGKATESVTITSAPPVLDTTDATLGAVMDNDMYSSLPLIMGAGNQSDQRRATDFAALMPGVQNTYSAAAGTGTNATDASGGVNGSANGGGTQEIYIDGVDLPSTLGVGDPRGTWTAFGMDSIDQFQVQTMGSSTQYAGQGVQNYSIKAGTNGFHGSLYEYFRNKVLDAWGTNNKTPTPVGIVPTGSKCSTATLTADTPWCKLGGVKPAEIQNEYGVVISGPIIKNKLFLFYNYGQYRVQKGPSPTLQTLPTLNMMGYDNNGNVLPYADYTGFQAAQVAGTSNAAQPIYDPATQTQVAGLVGCSTSGPTYCNRNAFPNNQIPRSRFSQAANYFDQYLLPLEAQTSQTQYVNNIAMGEKSGLSNWYQTGRLDYTLSASQQIAVIVAFGRQSTTGLNAGGTLPPPFNTSQTYHPDTTVDMIKHTWVIRPNMVNQFSTAYMRYISIGLTPDNQAQYSSANSGLLGLPAGQASNFPKISWSGTNVPGTWAGYSANSKTNNTFTTTDSLQWEKGKHSLTLGGQFVAMEYNQESPLFGSGPAQFTFNQTQTQGYTSSGAAISNSGAAYASYLLGAVNSLSALNVGTPKEFPRFHDPSFWVQDNIRATPKLTINAGLRWDIWPAFREKNNFFTWLNPTGVNPITGNLGTLAFAGGDPSDGYHTGRSNPSNLWWKNLAPRLGLAYSLDPKTVLRASYGLSFARGNWVSDSGQSGSPSTTGLLPTATALSTTAAGQSMGSNEPSFYWDGTACTTANGGNGSLAADGLTSCGFTGSLAAPATTLPAGVSMAGFGAYQTATLKGANAASPTYWDPYYGSRAPEYENWSISVDRQLNKDTSISVSYVGSEGHFIKPSGSTGTYWNNKLPESYAALAAYSQPYSTATGKVTGQNYQLCSGSSCEFSMLSQKANATTTSGLVQAQAFGFTPQNGFSTGNSTYYSANTIGSYYAPFPQYSGVSTTTSFMGNENYNAVQIVAKQRAAHGLSYMVSYIFAKNIDDLGSFRVYDNERLDRSLSAASQPHNLTVTAVWQLPVGKGHMFGDNMIYRSVVSNWSLSGIGILRSGLPIIVTATGCGGASILNTCMPSVVPKQKGRQNDWGKTSSGQTISWDPSNPNNIANINVVNPNAFTVNQAGVALQTSSPTTVDQYGTTDGQAINVGNGPALYVPGNAPRVAPLGMFSQKPIDVDLSLRRTFAIHGNWKLALQADMVNVANHVLYATPADKAGDSSCIVTKGSSASFCNVYGVAAAYQPRDVQLAGRISW